MQDNKVKNYKYVCSNCKYETKYPNATLICPRCGEKLKKQEDNSTDNESLNVNDPELMTLMQHLDDTDEDDIDRYTDVLIELNALKDKTTNQNRATEINLLTEEIRDKLENIVSCNREFIQDTFAGSINIIDDKYVENESGVERVRFSAIVGQVDTINKNNRLYPKEEILANIPTVQKLMKAGMFHGLLDHPGFLSSALARDIAVLYDKVMLKGNDIYLEGQTTLNEAGRTVVDLLKSGVGLEWSLRGWGNVETSVTDEGIEYDTIKNYIWDSVDIVTRGAADTRIVSFENQNNDNIEDSQRVIMENRETQPKEVKETTEVQQVPNLDEIKAAVAEQAAKAAEAQAVEITKQILEARDLAEYKAKKLAGIDESIRTPIERAFEHADSKEAVDKVMEDFSPLVNKVLKSQNMPTGIGIITEETRRKGYVEKWIVGDNVLDRPETAEEAFAQLIDTYPVGKNATDSADWNNPRNVWRQVLVNERREHPEYFHAVTRQGILETATTTTALGTTLPTVLPMLRQLFPQLVPFEISSVQPLSAPTGRVYTQSFKTSSDVDLSDSSTFDSTWADHTEGETKAQITLEMDYEDVSATSKAIYYDITSELRQDMKALFDLDAESELIRAAADEIVREINYQFLEMLRVGASNNVNYGTVAPTGYTSDKDWYDLLGAHIEKASSLIAESAYIPGDWMVVGPGAAPILRSLNGFAVLPAEDQTQFGIGLKRIGQLDEQWRVYRAEWFSRNTILVGFKPPSWEKTGAVYAPYVPLYISPEAYTPSTNTTQRSVSTRAAMKVLRGGCFATVTVQPGTTGVAPF